MKFAIFLLLAFPLVCVAQEDQPLQLTIRLEKQVYELGEEIDIEVNIKNTGRDIAKIYSPDYWGVSEIIVTNSKGIRMEPKGIKIERTYFEYFMAIPANESRTHIFDNLRWFHCGGAWQFIDEAQLLPDTYNIYVTITNPPRTQRCGQLHQYVKTNLSGTITSNTITIEIVEKRNVKEGGVCNSDNDCLQINCAKYDTPVKEGYKPFCVNNICKCMCYGCQ